MASMTHEASSAYPTTTSDAPFILTSSAARILGVSRDTVRVWERAGRLRALRTADGVRLFTRADVEQLALDRRIAAEAHDGRAHRGRARHVGGTGRRHDADGRSA